MDRSFNYKIDSDFDHVIDEKGNTFIALRKIQWNESGPYKLDLRKYYAKEEGETMSKGVSFLTDDGPNELTKVLIETGYGTPSEIANTIVYNRPDILKNIYKIVDTDPNIANGNLWEEDEEETYYDAEELMA